MVELKEIGLQDYKTDYRDTLKDKNTLAENRTEKDRLDLEISKALESQSTAQLAYQGYVDGGQELLNDMEQAKLAVSKLMQMRSLQKEHILKLVYE
jgi:hypothetical protein